MTCFEIKYFSENGYNITLKPDGSIELYQGFTIDLENMNQENKVIEIEYNQARILKEMIVAEHLLNHKNVRS